MSYFFFIMNLLDLFLIIFYDKKISLMTQMQRKNNIFFFIIKE